MTVRRILTANLKFLFLFIISLSSFSSDFFPPDYEYSKSRFLKNCKKTLSLFPLSKIGSIKIDNASLTVDHILIQKNSSAKKLIVLTSGTHGPEAYAGSAIQTIFFNEVLQNIDLEKVSVLIVHALNPWGFKHNRRGTQKNINLNRNFSLSSKLFRIKNENYLKIKNQLEVREPVTTTFNYPSANLAWQMLTRKNVNLDSLTEAVGRGQYTSPTGINYGGSDFEPQVKSMISLFKEVTPKFKHIFHIDLHTGLGDNGVLHIMTNDEMNQISKKNLKKIFLEERDSDNYELTNSNTHGFYKILGDYAAIISLINPEPEKVIIGITAEFGTVGRGLFGKLTTANRLIRENQGHFSGYTSEKVKKAVIKDYLELFNPSDESWKKNVLRKGRYLLKTIIRRFINLETSNS